MNEEMSSDSDHEESGLTEVSSKPLLFGTVLLSHLPSTTEDELLLAVAAGLQDSNSDGLIREETKCTRISKNETLVSLYSYNPEAHVNQLNVAPDTNCEIVRTWSHRNIGPTTVKVLNLPPKCDLGSFFDAMLDVEFQGPIQYGEDKKSAVVDLVDPSDLPYLITQSPCTYKKQQLEFIDPNNSEFMHVEDIEDESFSPPLPTNDDQAGIDDVDSNHNICSGLKITFHPSSTSNLLDANMMEFVLRKTFKDDPAYNLDISEFSMIANEAILSFSNPDGVSKVLQNPQPSLLCVPVTFHSVPLDQVRSEPIQVPSFLIMEDLPTLDMSQLRCIILMLFNNNGFEVADIKINKDVAYIWFKNDKVIMNIVEHPPEDSKFLGKTVIYKPGFASDVSMNSAIVRINNLPDGCSQFKEAFITYLKNVTSNSRITHCDVQRQEAVVKFEEIQVALKLVQTPPKDLFIGRIPTFETIPHYDFPSLSELNAEGSPVTLHNKKIFAENSPPLPQYRPKPRPRTPKTINKHKSFFITNLPLNTKEPTLRNYLEVLTGSIMCTEIKLKTPKAAVVFSEAVDFQQLNSRIESEKFGETTLQVEPLPPLLSVLITSSEETEKFDVKYYCLRISETKCSKIERKNNKEFLVTFSSTDECEKFLKDTRMIHHHRIESINLTFTPYHPILATLEETDDTPPLVPPRLRTSSIAPLRSVEPQDQVYTWPPVIEDVDASLGRFLQYTLDELNQQLVSEELHTEAVLQADSIQFRPQALAYHITGWEHKVLELYERHKKGFVIKHFEVEKASRHGVMVGLQKYLQKQNDFHYEMADGDAFRVSGCVSSVEQVSEIINHIEETVTERTMEFEKQHFEIQYLLQLEKGSFDSINPPIKIQCNETKPGVLLVTGVKCSLKKFEELANEKIAEIHCEYVFLTRAAYRLLNSNQGKEKLHSFDTICHVYLPTPASSSSEFSHQVCIMSSKRSQHDVAFAKKVFEDLSKEEKFSIPQEKRGILLSKEWTEKVNELITEHFVSIRSTNEDYVTVTGCKNDVSRICEALKSFIETQHETTEDIVFKKPVWDVLSSQAALKLTAVKEMADKKKVFFIDNKGKEGDHVVVTLKGAVEGVQSIKTMLLQMKKADISEKAVTIESKPGLRKLSEDQMINSKCQELSKKHNVEIQFEVIDDAVTADVVQKTPKKLLFTVDDGPCPGAQIKFYTGDYTQARCDAIVAFVSDEPSLKEDVLLSLRTAGGQELVDDVETLLLYSTDIVSASYKFSRLKGDLRCDGIYYAILPPYSDANAIKAARALENVLVKIMENAKTKYDRVVLCPITSHMLHYPPNALAKAIVSSISVSDMYTSDFILSVYIDDSKQVDEFTEVFRSHTFQITYPQARDTTMSILSSSSNSKMQFPIVSQSLKNAIELVKGNMLDQQVDVYINSTNSTMDFSSGALSCLLKKNCGKPLMTEVEEYIKKHGQLNYTDVAVTDAHNLKAKKIYHIVLKPKNQTDYVDNFKQTVENVLTTAMNEGHKSIAIPCLGVAGLNYPREIAASALFESVALFHAKHPNAIQKFLFVVYESKNMKAFEDAYQKLINPTTEYKVCVKPVTNSEVLADGNGFRFEVYYGDLAKEQMAVIVNSTSIDLQKNANKISEALFGAGGAKLKNACSKLVKDGKRLDNGNVLATTGGDLKCTEVYHVHVPGKASLSAPPTSTEASIMQTAINECLSKAEASKHKSISFPAFNLMAGKFTCKQSGELMFQCMEKFAQTVPKHVKHVKVVIFNQEKYKEFCDSFKQYFTAGASTVVVLKHIPSQDHTPWPVRKTRNNVTFPATTVPQRPTCQKSSAVFHIYGISGLESVALAEKGIKAYFNEMFVKTEVELGELVDLFQASTIGEIFKNAQEENVEIEFERSMKRFILSGEKRAVKIVSGKIEVIKTICFHSTNDLERYEWLAEDMGSDSSSMMKYPDEAMKLIESAYKKKESKIEILLDSIQTVIDLKKMEEYDTVSGIQRKIHRRQKPKEIDPPPEWCQQPCDQHGKKHILHLEPIPESSVEYKKATGRFQDTLGNLKHSIQSVQRIQNPGEYARYMTLKQTWESMHAQGKVREREVFHGTKQASIMLICSQGFNRNFAADANAAYFGQGTYFALNASYSAQRNYSPEDDDGVKHILVCSMVVGEYTKGNKSMKSAPIIPNTNGLVTYDTLVDNEANPTIFVALKDAQAYPKYWIKFKIT